MKFYEEISKYYDNIFPVKKSKLDFIKKAAGDPPASIFDIACGSGGYSIELAKAGYIIWAADLDAQMISITEEKALIEGVDIKTIQSDMLSLGGLVCEKFDCIYCIGNSIVHLKTIEEIRDAVNQMKYMLKDEGKLILQTINYDRIINKNVKSLPLIKDEDIGLEFIRNYNYIEGKELISFDTILKVNSEEYINSVELYPLMYNQLKEILNNAGFNNIKFYGGFDESEYSNNESYAMVVTASV